MIRSGTSMASGYMPGDFTFKPIQVRNDGLFFLKKMLFHWRQVKITILQEIHELDM